MKKRVRIKDIAEKAGVSAGTVDRVLHNRGHVAREVRDKVIAVMDEVGYERNLFASALAFNKEIKIGVLLPDYTLDIYWQQPYQGMQMAGHALKHYGIRLEFVFFDSFKQEDFLPKAQQLLQADIDGLLFPPIYQAEGLALLGLCQEAKIPVVQINTLIEHPHVSAYIGQDSFQSGILAARLLNFALHDGQMALILNLEKSAASARHLMEKERGFRFYFANYPHKNIHIVSVSFEQFDDQDKLRAFLATYTSAENKLGGIFVTNSRAYKVLSVLDADLIAKTAIVGFDLIAPNLEHLATNEINFLINQNSVEQGYQGIYALFKLLFLKETPPLLHFLPLDIVVSENVQYYLQRQEKLVLLQ